MAREEDDDDGLPPIGEGTDGHLEDAKKGKSRFFLLICKGTKVKYLKVKKKSVKKSEIADAKKLGYKGDPYIGVLTGKGMDLVFNLAISEGYESEPVKDKILKDFLEEHADFKCKPSFAIVATPPDIPFDDEELSHPLIARFLALGESISQVLDARPEAEEELKQTVSGIRVLLQDGDFNEAEPKINTLEARLKELASGGELTGEPDSTEPLPPTPTSSPTPSSPEVVTEQDPLKKKLLDALGKLVPQLKEAVARFPDRKVELLTPVATVKKQLDANELQDAKENILKLGQLLKTVQPTSKTTSDNPTDSETPSSEPVQEMPDPLAAELKSGLKAEFDEQLAELQPDYDKVLKGVLGDVGKMRAFMAAALEKAEAGDHVTAIRVLDRLRILVSEAQTTGASAEFAGLQAGLIEKRMYMLTRFRELPGILHPLLMELRDEIIAEEADENPAELTAALELALNELCDVIQAEVDVSISSGNPSDLQGMKARVLSHDVAKHLLDNPFVEGSSFQQAIFAVLDEVEANLKA